MDNICRRSHPPSAVRFALALAVLAVAALAAPSKSFAEACIGASYTQSYCLDGNRSNPSIAKDSSWRAENECHGTMKVQMGWCGRHFLTGGCSGDDHGSQTFTLGKGAERSGSHENGVGYVQCCDTGTTELTVNGRTWNLCDISQSDYQQWERENPANSEGEVEAVCAKTNSCNCGDHWCTVGDCEWHWKRSPAYKAMSANPAEPHCKDLYENSISASDGTSQTCTIRMKCWNGYYWSDGSDIITWARAKEEVWLIDDLSYCQPEADRPTDYGHLTTASSC